MIKQNKRQFVNAMCHNIVSKLKFFVLSERDYFIMVKSDKTVNKKDASDKLNDCNGSGLNNNIGETDNFHVPSGTINNSKNDAASKRIRFAQRKASSSLSSDPNQSSLDRTIDGSYSFDISFTSDTSACIEDPGFRVLKTDEIFAELKRRIDECVNVTNVSVNSTVLL